MNTKYLFCLCLLIFFSLFSSLNAEEKKNSGIEKGFRFGNFSEEKESEDEKVEISEDDIGKLLKEILKENRKQSKLQKEIRDLIASEINPSPKTITVDGKECIENEDEKCFKMPLIREVRSIPAIKNALTKRDLESVKKQEQWYAKYLTEIIKVGYLKGLAIREMGPDYPLARRPEGTVDAGAGWDAPILENHRRNIFKKELHNFEFNFFIGLNIGLDMYSLSSIANVAKSFPEIKLNLVFKDKKSKIIWEKQYKNLYAAKYLKKLNAVIQPSSFDEFKVYTTPSLFLKDHKNSKNIFLHVGKINQLTLINKTIDYMLQNKFIERKDLSSTKAWNSEGGEKYIENYYRNKLGIKYEK